MRDAKNMVSAEGSYIVGEWILSKREAGLQPARLKAPSPSELIFYHSVPQMLDMDLQDLMFVLLGFGFTLTQLFLSLIFLHFGMGKFTLYHCFLGLTNFFFPEVCLES